MTDQKVRDASNLVLQWDWDELRKSPNHVDWAEALQNIDDLAHALGSAQQADHVGDANEMVAAPVVPEEWRQAVAGLVDDIDGLISESSGVCGLHLNGDMAPWDELTEGGRFERLAQLEAVRALLAAPAPARTSVGWSACHEGHYTPSGRAAPEQREKVELTDAEIDRVWIRKVPEIEGVPLPWVRKFARAVLAAYEAKQKGVSA